MEEKEDEWIEKRIGGLDMATMITKWESSYEGHVTRTNKQLRQWLKKIISLSNRREVKVREIRELLTSIKTFQQSYDYKHLPCDYPYFLFIEEIKDKIKKSIISFELEGVESAKLFLSEKAQADITYTLLDIEQE